MKVRSNIREQAPEGVHMARTQGLTNLGHQPGFTWTGGDVASAYKLELTYELVDAEMGDGRPFWVSEDLTNTDNERGKLRTRCAAAGINISDIDTIIDKPVMITIEHNDKGYVKIVNVTGVPKGVNVAPLRNPVALFDIYDEKPDVEAFNSMPEFKQGKIRAALDFDSTVLAAALRVDEDEI